MYGTQCIDISNTVFIQMFFMLFSNRMISFFTLQCELFTSCNVSNNASLVSAWTGGRGVVNQMWTGLDRPGQVEGGPKNCQIWTDILYGIPHGSTSWLLRIPISAFAHVKLEPGILKAFLC